MRKTLLVLILTIVCTGLLFAGGTENKINSGAGYARFPSKATECKKPDAMFYNPAGTAFIKSIQTSSTVRHIVQIFLPIFIQT